MSGPRPLLFRWQEAIRDSGLKPTTRHVLLTLATYANRNGGNAHPGRERLVHDTGLTLRTVAAAFREARQAGWVIEVYHGGGRSGKASVWRLAIPVADPSSNPSDDAADPPSDGLSGATDALSRASDAPSSSNSCPPIRTEHGIEQEQHSDAGASASAANDAADAAPPGPLDPDTALDYAETLFLARGGNPRRLTEAVNLMSTLITERGFNWRHAVNTAVGQMKAPPPRTGPPTAWRLPDQWVEKSGPEESEHGAASVARGLFGMTEGLEP